MKRIVDEFAAARRSPSAEMVAVLRAAHQVRDRPIIHADPLAMGIIGAEGRRWLDANPAMLDIDYVRAIRGMVTLRSRLSEDELARAAARGTTQYVVLGAGLDTFAYRQPEFAETLTIFEVDEAETQAWKLERLEEAGIDLPDNLRFVPVNFNSGTLAEALADAGFNRNEPAFFAWLGVSYYLPLETIVEIMRFVASHQATSEVVFDIALPESQMPQSFLPTYKIFREQMSKAVEPWLTWLEPAEFVDQLVQLGFTDVEFLDSATLIGRYLPGRTDGVQPGPIMALVLARKCLV